MCTHTCTPPVGRVLQGLKTGSREPLDAMDGLERWYFGNVSPKPCKACGMLKIFALAHRLWMCGICYSLLQRMQFMHMFTNTGALFWSPGGSRSFIKSVSIPHQGRHTVWKSHTHWLSMTGAGLSFPGRSKRAERGVFFCSYIHMIGFTVHREPQVDIWGTLPMQEEGARGTTTQALHQPLKAWHMLCGTRVYVALCCDSIEPEGG